MTSKERARANEARRAAARLSLVLRHSLVGCHWLFARLPGRSNLSWRWKHVLIRRQRTALGKNREMQVGCIWSWRGTRKGYPVAVAALPRQGSPEPKAGKPVFDGLVPLGCLVRHFPVV